MNKTKVSIVGASGYTGVELVKILLKHKSVQIAHLAVRRDPLPVYSELFPELRGFCDVQCSKIDADLICKDSDIIFFALPHTISMTVMSEFLDKGKKIIDLSADYRIKDIDLYKKAYGQDHEDIKNLEKFIYALPEINKEEIKTSSLVANPGCFPTGILLALYPLLLEKIISLDNIIVDSKTGISGGGKNPNAAFHFPECNENFKAYKVGVHQHEVEIEQELKNIAGKEVDIIFVPHLLPVTRGIFSTIYTDLLSELTSEEISKIYEKYYKEKEFVRLLKENIVPEIKNVTYTNMCEIGFKLVGKKLIVMSAIDNLIKGASGQAVQNMNLMCGFDEQEGLL